MAENNLNPETTNLPDDNPDNSSKPRSSRGLMYVILIVALAGTWGYLLWDKSQHNQKEEQLTTQVVTTDSARNEVQREFDAANAQIDQLTSQNTHLDSLIKSKTKDLADIRSRIQTILRKQNATEAELNEARQLINELNAKIAGYIAQIEKLEGEKLVLTSQRDSVQRNLDTATAQNQDLSKKVDLGSVLHASNIKITALHVKNSGKEVTTTKAKRADMMRISFNLDENRITPTGPKDLYVCITAPDNTPLAVEALGSGKFTLADGTEKLYTAMKTVDYTIGQKSDVNIDWKQNSAFKPGAYKVEIYEGGYLIGQGNVDMRKGGLF
jgi:hypothetical protein